MFFEVIVYDNNNVFGLVIEVIKNVRNCDYSKNIKLMLNVGKYVISGNVGKVMWI